MAILNKKLKIKDSEGTTVDCNIYTTQTEAGDTTLQMKVNNESAYVTLGETNGYGATKGRVKINGETHAIMSKASLPYTEQSWTEPGTYTFTVPAGVTRVRVAVCGGGGGSAHFASENGEAGKGGDSSFDSFTATGGTGGKQYYGNETGGIGGTPNGRNGQVGSIRYNVEGKGGTGFSLSFSLSDGDFGEGGSHQYGCGGGSGGYNTGYIDVVPNSTIAVNVGSGGKRYYSTDADGEAGFVLIAYGGEI